MNWTFHVTFSNTSSGIHSIIATDIVLFWYSKKVCKLTCFFLGAKAPLQIPRQCKQTCEQASKQEPWKCKMALINHNTLKECTERYHWLHWLVALIRRPITLTDKIDKLNWQIILPLYNKFCWRLLGEQIFTNWIYSYYTVIKY